MSEDENRGIGGAASAGEIPAIRAEADDGQLVDEIAEDVKADILLGHVEDDVSSVLEERLEEVGLHLPSEDLEELADEIENDVSS